MLFKFPLRVPTTRKVYISQGFKSTELVQFYKKKGLNITEHNAIDVIAGTPIETYGTPFVCPFPLASPIAFEPDNDNIRGGRIQVRYIDMDGKSWVMGGLHLFDLVKQETYKEGDVLGYVGNYGAVSPEPQIGAPFAGSHLHLTLVVDGKVVDPSMYFDQKSPYEGADTGIEKDAGRFMWAIKKAREMFSSLLPK